MTVKVFLLNSAEMDQSFWQQIPQKIRVEQEEERNASLLELRRKLTIINPPVANVVQAGLVPLLINILETER